MAEIKFKIIKKIGVLSRSESGWTKELNQMRWNEQEPEDDLREWSPDRGMRDGVYIFGEK